MLYSHAFIHRNGLEPVNLIYPAAAALLFATLASAQPQWSPTRPVRLIAPFPPGGAVDVIGRIVARASTPAEFHERITRDITRWAEVVKKAKIAVE